MIESAPARPPTRCCCRMKVINHETGEVYGHDACPSVTSGPDEPICTGCVINGHPEDPNFDPAIPSVLTPERSDE